MRKLLKTTCALGLLGLATFALISCDRTHPKDQDYADIEECTGVSLRKLKIEENQYIVIEENGINTLHKGDVEVMFLSAYNKLASLPPILTFNCGETIRTNEFKLYPNICPSKEKYDKVCKCAYTLTQDDVLNEENHVHIDCEDELFFE